MSENELRCDCDTEARPKVEDSNWYKGKWMKTYYYVECPVCGLVGNVSDTYSGAVKNWENGERFSKYCDDTFI
jgi:hypothetical protein